MNFGISGEHIEPIYLVVIGFLIGVMGGFFGVGGSFLAGPALFAFGVPPMIALPVSGIAAVSLWAILGVAFVGGFFGGFLGGGAGYIRMPALVYLLGVPTHVAVGTDLFEIMISASYGTLTHALKGNVDILIALVMHTGAAIGAQLGATATSYFAGSRIRLAFAPLPLIGAAIIIYGLITGHHAK